MDIASGWSVSHILCALSRAVPCMRVLSVHAHGIVDGESQGSHGAVATRQFLMLLA